MPKVSVTIITLNESAHIEACLASVAWADEVLVVDSHSTDGTADLARAAGARVIVRDWPGYSAQKNFAAAEATNDWILSIDADERVTRALAEAIRTRVSTEPVEAGFRVPRLPWHLGRWIRTTDWYPDYQLRLYDRRRAAWVLTRVHESVSTSGLVGRLDHDLQHYPYRDLSHHLATMDKYTTLAARDMHERGRRAGLFDLTLHPLAAFLRNYVLRRGALDGVPGFIISVMNAYYVFMKFAKLRELDTLTAAGSSRPPAT